MYYSTGPTLLYVNSLIKYYIQPLSDNSIQKENQADFLEYNNHLYLGNPKIINKNIVRKTLKGLQFYIKGVKIEFSRIYLVISCFLNMYTTYERLLFYSTTVENSIKTFY